MNISDIISQDIELPTLSTTSLNLVKLMGQSEPDIDEFVKVVQYDPALTARVLKLSNSGFFGMAQGISTLQDSVMTIGILRLLQIVMAVDTSDIFKNYSEDLYYCYGQTPEDLWKDSVGVALASNNINKRLCISSSGLSFIGGLLHDVGKPLLAAHARNHFQEIKSNAQSNKISLIQSEKSVLGINHLEVGSALLRNWELPEEIITIVENCKQPTFFDPPDSILVHFALGIVSELESEEHNFNRIDSTFKKKFSLYDEDLVDICDETLEEMSEIVESLFF